MKSLINAQHLRIYHDPRIFRRQDDIIVTPQNNDEDNNDHQQNVDNAQSVNNEVDKEIVDETTYEVECLLGKKTMNGVVHYKCKWKDGSTPTWEPIDNIAENLIEDYHIKFTQQGKRRKRKGNVTSRFSLMLMFIVMVILPLSIVGGHMTVQAINAEEDIHRLNYGVLFQKQPSLYLSREYWLHTFEVELPSNISIQSIPSCTAAVSTCYLFNSIIFHVNVLKENTMTFTHRTLMEIFDMVPETNLNPQKRKSRALLPFIGSLSKSFFGTATMDDVNLLANHINKLIKRDRQMSHALEQHGSHISSFMKVVNHRFDKLKKGMNLNHKLANQILSSNKQFEILMANLSMVAFEQISKANEIQVQLVNTLSSIQSLINGKITPHLIPEHVLKKTINGILDILQRDFPKFHLLQNKPSMYYQNAKFFFTRHHSRLYITMKFPISSFSSALTLYKILSFPHPISQKNTTKASQILDLPTYVAITANHRHFTTFNYETLYNCEFDRYITCDVSLPIQTIKTSSCIFALLHDNKSVIFDQCNFRLLPELTKPNIFELSPASILLTNAKEVTLKCPNKTSTLPGCQFCIQNIPCSCTLQTSTITYHPRLVNCQEKLQESTRLYPINLALLHAFFGFDKVKSYFGNAYFKTAVNISIPNFKFYNHKFNSILASDIKDHLNLKKIAKSAKKDETIFQNLAEPLLDGQITLDSNWPDTNGYLAIASITIGGISFIGFVYMFLQFRSLRTSLLILQQVHNVHSKSTVPSFLFEAVTQTTTQSFLDSAILKEFTWVHGSLIVGVLILILLICVLVCLFKHKSHNTTIMLEITSGGSCATIPVTSFPLCPSYWDIQPPVTIQNVQICNFPFGKLSVEWPGFKVINKLTKQSLTVKTCFKVGLFNYFKIRRIINQPYCAYILIVHQGLATPLQENQEPLIPKIPQYQEFQNNLYPNLEPYL
ncbi:unnamed protein product [Mytilus edulis]|uniref:Chromo domain-containing protein n=1 Tax=Mytilus edulis TaxID=6550 RepID=A0A8S3SS70_MYTED|nr:unnamed protein product [Mytilus edulis]